MEKIESAWEEFLSSGLGKPNKATSEIQYDPDSGWYFASYRRKDGKENWAAYDPNDPDFGWWVHCEK